MRNWKRTAIIMTALSCTILFAASDCEGGEDEKSSIRETGEKLTAQAYEQQSAAVPYPSDKLKDSLERRNLRERLLRQNEPDKIGYVYILSFGDFIGYYTIEGKVSSTQSQMTPSDYLDRWDCGNACGSSTTTENPGDDGSFGENEPGVFFFTTEGAMVQVSTDYIYSDQPIGVGGIPELNKGR